MRFSLFFERGFHFLGLLIKIACYLGTGNQSDASTTSGSRDSDSVSVIYKPSGDAKQITGCGKKEIEHPKPP